MPKPKKKAPVPQAESYQHAEADSLMRPDVGTQAQFKKRKPPQRYEYDSSLSPTLVWAGKAEHVSFDVPTLPLFIHERLSTKAIIETLKGHKRDKQLSFLDLFGDPQRPIVDQVLGAYEYRDGWTNRMILGDSLAVMNSLLHYENLGGQVQMIYMDPPYGVKFGSNFQPFVRKRDVTHNDDDDFTREPEMVQAYRDTWELGLHSYLTYMRDRLLLCRELLHPSGSVFVQISDENLHHVRELMDEVFGAESCCSVVSFMKTAGQTSELLASTSDFLLWYCRDRERVKFRQPFVDKTAGFESAASYNYVELPDGVRRKLSPQESLDPSLLPGGSRLFRLSDMTSQRQGRASGPGSAMHFPVKLDARTFFPSGQRGWRTTAEGMEKLIRANRLLAREGSLGYVLYIDDFPVSRLGSTWLDTSPGFNAERSYVVQTVTKVIQRCLLMTTDPGDLVLDPTCGSGTTAYVAEQWGRRWITIDVSRVPLALARQRLLTAMFPWYELKDDARGPAGGFVYKRKQNNKGEEVGGIVPHVTLKSIANNEPPAEEVLVDRPEVTSGITRVTGTFAVEGTIPQAVGSEQWAVGSQEQASATDHGQRTTDNPAERMLEVLRKSPVLRLEGNKTVTFKNVRPPAKTLSLSAEALVANGEDKPVAFVFGPENGAVSERLVYEAAKEANAKSYTHLYVIGFAIQPNARKLIESCDQAVGIAATYVQATPDLLMGDLLKNMRSSQIFSVCGLPEIRISRKGAKEAKDAKEYQVELLGFDVFDPVTMEVKSRKGDDVPAWLLDTDYNGLCFHVNQAFFPRTGAWDNLKKALKGTYEEGVWDHLAGTVSAPFEAGEHGQVAVKVIDDRGNELLVVKGI
jgi:adenine-specific DNA-methyltransferase